MIDIRETGATIGTDQTPIFEATPPCRPAPMPTQTIAFWTPRRNLATMIATLKEFRRPTRMTQRAVVPVLNADESR
jgi:hypothetical protein